MSYLKQYEYLLAVDQCGSISLAAERLGVSQPTFSKYVKRLETDLGVELIDRTSLPIKLTGAGRAFLNAGRRFLDMDRQLKKELEEIKGGRAVVRVGISPSRAPYVLPEVVAAFRNACPHARVIIEERTTDELNERLRLGELDLVISLLSDDSAAFCREELFEEDIWLAVPTGFVREGESASDLIRRVPLVSVGRGQVMWRAVNDAAATLGADVPVVECQSIESAMALVKGGVGATLVPSYMATERGDGVSFLPLSGVEHAPRKVCVFFRAEQYLSQAERQFVQCVVAACGQRRAK